LVTLFGYRFGELYNLGTNAWSGRDQEIHGGAAWFFYTRGLSDTFLLELCWIWMCCY